ncbi:TNF receptor-associated factor 4-like [Corticium candelabrum]|uniref:TNF receptor-associated factor 4-like n=1 Tax=Corticium candelabrum TaxID=121492 RepID=UPI002E269D42|nr:TNF receptor-associated factor 4-like [Corticium candelabrum]
MSSGQSSGGFEAHFVEPLIDLWKCPICLLAAREPKLTECGHQFCTECLGPLMGGNTLSCPVCRKSLNKSQVYPNNMMKREILSLKIECDQCKKGCTWQGELRQREEHNKQCGYVPEACSTNCGQSVMRKDMDNHRRQVCRRRVVVCSYCGTGCTWQGELRLREQHNKQCGYVPEACSNDCGQSVMRKDMDNHRRQVCRRRIVVCSYCGTGCTWQGELRLREQHNKQCGYVPEACSNNCGQSVMRKDMDNHRRQVCRRRIVVCSYCGTGCTWQGQLRLREQHNKQCGYVPEACSNNCGQSVMRKDMDNHRQQVCRRRIVVCSYCGTGCTWKGELRQREQHNKQCGYVPEACSNNCGQSVMRKDMDNHRRQVCRRRVVVCSYCRTSLECRLLRGHYGTCDSYPVDCPYECGMQIARKDVELHTSEEDACSNKPLACKFASAGCQFIGNKRHLKDHMQTSTVYHHSLAMKSFIWNAFLFYVLAAFVALCVLFD